MIPRSDESFQGVENALGVSQGILVSKDPEPVGRILGPRSQHPKMSHSKRPRSRAPGWWIPGLDERARRDGLERIASGANPGFTYFVLIVLSTLIAAFGLLSNSTATVIGAMIVAPLMGPILGLAMGVVSGDTDLFRRSLMAEIAGVGVVVAVGFIIATAVGVEQIDFSASEIAGRTRPTLFDLAIGLAAGFAGAFCMINPGLQASVAGVAIAVALVPPLTVTGITAAGWWAGSLAWRPAFGSFMLFLANYLTIELAASVLFYSVGFHIERENRERSAFRKTIAANLILLLLTVVFLTQQLHTLVRERVGMVTARRSLEKGLSDIPGADLDTLDVVLRGQDLTVNAVVGSRQTISPGTVSLLEEDLRGALARALPGVQGRLIVRTVSSVYASPSGYLFEPKNHDLSPEQERARRFGEAIAEALQAYPEVENEGFRLVSGQGAQAWNVELTLRAPFEFTPTLVADLQNRIAQALESGEVKLLVRSVMVKVATAETQVAVLSRDNSETENPLLRQLTREVLESAGAEITSLSIRPRPPEPGQESLTLAEPSLATSTPDAETGAPTPATPGVASPTPGQPESASPAPPPLAYDVSVEARAAAFLEEPRLSAIRERIRELYRQREGQEIALRLAVRITLSQTTVLGPP